MQISYTDEVSLGLVENGVGIYTDEISDGYSFPDLSDDSAINNYVDNFSNEYFFGKGRESLIVEFKMFPGDVQLVLAGKISMKYGDQFSDFFDAVFESDN